MTNTAKVGAANIVQNKSYICQPYVKNEARKVTDNLVNTYTGASAVGGYYKALFPPVISIAPPQPFYGINSGCGCFGYGGGGLNYAAYQDIRAWNFAENNGFWSSLMQGIKVEAVKDPWGTIGNGCVLGAQALNIGGNLLDWLGGGLKAGNTNNNSIFGQQLPS